MPASWTVQALFPPTSAPKARSARASWETSCSRTSSSSPPDTLGEIAERMSERDVGSALVLDYGRLIGIITARDLLRAFAGRVHASEARAREWMTAEPIAVPPLAPSPRSRSCWRTASTTSRWSRTSDRSGCSASGRPSAARTRPARSDSASDRPRRAVALYRGLPSSATSS